ncbi:uncharacterized protein ALTATR162_LOCUS5035 [Alternaria atra]|uniref:Uncharacterized protein n=1 Tax=Alternaria atra TaxID=119953 RepID=A0A8J2I1L6_9PLEO|nr:uncharacterized protein ALTATR162_LOCUS5035 [Alternaria atra]CAG5158201.1 unnamed protein product [Alternaria atra]
MAKRQRYATQPFEQGVNPPPGSSRASKRRKALSENPSQANITPTRGTAKAVTPLTPPATLARAQDSPLFEPSCTQSAIDAQADDIVGDDDEDRSDIEAPEGDDEAETGVADAVGGTRDAQIDTENAVLETRVTPATPEQEIILDPMLDVRWRACWGDLERNAIAQACDCDPAIRLSRLTSTGTWDWVDGVLADVLPRVAIVVSLVAVVYTRKEAKKERRNKRLRRNEILNWIGFKDLVKGVDVNSTEPVYVDFDLILADNKPVQAARPAPAAAPARARTATVIQEEGLAGVVAAEQAGSGWAMAIRDQWRCQDANCGNHPYVCWLPRTPGQPDRFEKHLPVNGNIIAMWARELAGGTGSVHNPSDDVRLAIVRAKDRADAEKSRRRGAVDSGGGGDNEIASLTKLLIVNQLKQLTGHTNQAFVQAQQPESSLSWEPFEYTNWIEISRHTKNFFDWWAGQRTSGFASSYIKTMYRSVCVVMRLDINILLDNTDNGCPMKLWVEQTEFPIGALIRLRDAAKRWRLQYDGFTEQDLERIEAAKQRDRVHEPSSDIEDLS